MKKKKKTRMSLQCSYLALCLSLLPRAERGLLLAHAPGDELLLVLREGPAKDPSRRGLSGRIRRRRRSWHCRRRRRRRRLFDSNGRGRRRDQWSGCFSGLGRCCCGSLFLGRAVLDGWSDFGGSGLLDGACWRRGVGARHFIFFQNVVTLKFFEFFFSRSEPWPAHFLDDEEQCRRRRLHHHRPTGPATVPRRRRRRPPPRRLPTLPPRPSPILGPRPTSRPMCARSAGGSSRPRALRRSRRRCSSAPLGGSRKSPSTR